MDYAEEWYNSYKTNKNKDKLKVKDYIIIDESYYLKYKGNIKLSSIKGYTGFNSSTKKPENFILAETDTQYILIKYNGNFIAVNICEREYELYNKVVKKYGKPTYIYSDKGNEFKGEFSDYLKRNNTTIIL